MKKSTVEKQPQSDAEAIAAWRAKRAKQGELQKPKVKKGKAEK
jgi:hypothetical protein